jgi:branched-chain amino acid transport system ATP-binding protein
VTVLALDAVTLDYGAVRAVDHVTMTVDAGEICALVGPNGSGKSSLLNTISGFVTVGGGTIRVHERDVTTARSFELARLGVARTFQLIRLMNGMTVVENVAAGCYTELRRAGFGRVTRSLLSPGRLSSDMRARVDAALARAGVAEHAGDFVGELPFGTQRRVEVARAIVSRPRLLLFDEPAAGLSERDLEDLEGIIREEAARGCAVVLVDHHLHFVLRVCSRAVVLNFGQVIYDGPSGQTVDDPQVREAYVGN